MAGIAMIVTSTAAPGKREELYVLYREHLAPRAEANDGQEVVVWCADRDDPDRFHLFEIYRDEAALGANAQAEWFGLWVDGANGEPGQSFLTGGYASASVFLGEGSTRWYPMRGSLRPPNVAPAWSDLSPRWGEFEAVARVSWTDLVDGSINGGRVLDVEAGLNWYLTSTTRLMVHWLGVRAEDEGGSGVLGQALLGRILIQI